MTYVIHYQMVHDYETSVEADSPKEAIQSILNQWDNDNYWPFDEEEEPIVINARVDKFIPYEDDADFGDCETIMSIESAEEHPVHIIRKLAEVEPE